MLGISGSYPSSLHILIALLQDKDTIFSGLLSNTLPECPPLTHCRLPQYPVSHLAISHLQDKHTIFSSLLSNTNTLP